MIPPSIPCILSSGFWVIIFLHTQSFVPSKLGYDRETLESEFFFGAVPLVYLVWFGTAVLCFYAAYSFACTKQAHAVYQLGTICVLVLEVLHRKKLGTTVTVQE